MAFWQAEQDPNLVDVINAVSVTFDFSFSMPSVVILDHILLILMKIWG